jgi:putative acetyltransferase
MDVVMATEHIGSTAVPGLVAKPIVDIMLGIRATHLAPAPETLRQLGYELGHPEDHSPDWVYYVKRNPSGRRVAHLHIVVHEGAYWNKWLYFRDKLRSDPTLAREYVALKQELASTYRHDRLGYTFGKDRFVAQAIDPWNEEGLREEQLGDVDGIRAVHSAAFGRTAEADLVDQLRDGGFIVSSLVAVLNGRCVGNLVFSRIAISGADGDIPAVALAPVAVLPECQRHGIGTKLIEAGLERCRSLGRTVALVLGHPDYYRRFGF